MSDTKSTIEKAKALREEEKYEASLKLLRELYEENKGSKGGKDKELIRKVLVKVLFDYGHHLTDEWVLEYEKARDIFKEIIKIDPQDYRAHYNLGISLFYMRKYEEALINFNNALKIKPDYKFCHYNIGLVYEEMNLFRKALKAYTRALHIDPNFSYAKQSKRKIERAIETKSLPPSPKMDTEKVKQLKSLIRISRRINIDDIQDILELNRNILLPMIIDWAEDYGFELDGDYLVLNKESVPEFITDLGDLIHKV